MATIDQSVPAKEQLIPALTRQITAKPDPTSRGWDSTTPGVVTRSGLTKTEAEDLLDWLEANGFRERKTFYHPAKGFVVQYKSGQSDTC